jgi:hypothetical protein
MTCAICRTRRPRRFCPGVGGDICTICCGTEREVTVNCPLECEYLQDARRHEKLADLDPAKVPNQDVRITERFLTENEALVASIGGVLYVAALDTPGVVDFDIREALDGLIRTYRTLQSGVYYESRPNNPLAAAVFEAVQAHVAEFRKQEQQNLGMSKTRDADVLGVLVFFQRIEFDRNNGRKRGRAFVDALRDFYVAGAGESAPPESSLILP